MIYFVSISGTHACKTDASTYVDTLEVIWQLERIAFDAVMLRQF